MNRKFLINIAFLVLLNLLIKPFWFLGIEVSVQNRLDNETYGMFFSLLSFSMIFNFLLDFGITNFNNREIARHNNLISRYFSNIVGIKLFLGVVYAIICIAGSLFMGYGWLEISLLMVLVFNQFLSSFILYLRSNINGLLMFVADSILSVLDKVIMIGMLSILLWTNIADGAFKVQWFVYCQTVAYLITATVAFILVARKCSYVSISFDLKYFIIVIRKSLPFSILVLLMMLYNRVEPVLLVKLLPDGKSQAGIYAQGFRILEVLSNFAYLFPVLLLPLFSKMLKLKENINALVSLAAVIMIFPIFTIAISCSIYGNQIMAILYHEPEAGALFSVLIFGIVGISVTYLYGTLLTANGNLKYLNIMAATTVALNITLNFILIPRFKAQGAAWASLTTQSLSALVQLLLAYKILNLKWSSNRIFRVFLWFLLMAAGVYIIKQYVGNWLVGFVGIPVLGIVLLMVTKLLKIKELLKLFFTATESRGE